MWKCPIQHQRGVLCAQGARKEMHLKVLEHRIWLVLLTNTFKIPVLESILEKTVGYVLSESKEFSKKLYVHYYIGCIVS